MSQGGHSVPEATFERRCRRGIANLVNLYLPLADAANIYKGVNPGDLADRPIASKQGVDLSIKQPDLWYGILKVAAEEKA